MKKGIREEYREDKICPICGQISHAWNFVDGSGVSQLPPCRHIISTQLVPHRILMYAKVFDHFLLSGKSFFPIFTGKSICL